MVDFKGLDGFLAGQDGLERGAQPGYVPLSVADLIELAPDRILRRDGEGVVERAVGEADGQIGLEHEDALTDRLHEIQWNDIPHGCGSRTPSDDGMMGEIRDRKSAILGTSAPRRVNLTLVERCCR